jgi:acetoacetate decarboxylase
MKQDAVRKDAFAMPLTGSAYPPGPYRFVDREFLVITYRTDPDRLRALVPEPLIVEVPLVKYEFIRMPNATGFGNYTETGQVIPVSLNGRKGGYTHIMFLNDEPPIAGGRELRGLSEKTCKSRPPRRDRYARRHARLRSGSRRHGNDGLQTQGSRPRCRQDIAPGAEFPPENHSPC